jgi:hypothetical protein
MPEGDETDHGRSRGGGIGSAFYPDPREDRHHDRTPPRMKIAKVTIAVTMG